MIELENYFSIQIFFIILRETLETAIIISVLLSFINQNNPPINPQSGEEDEQETQVILAKHEEMKTNMRLQVWIGAISGLLVCLVIGLVFILCFYYIGKDYWSYTERIWEGAFSILSSVIITVMGLGLLRINKIMKVKWWMKLGDAYNGDSVAGDHQKSAGELELELDPDAAEEEITRLTESTSNSVSYENRNDDVLSGTNTQSRLSRSRFGRTKKKYFLAILPLITTLREGLEAVVFVGGMGVSNPLTSLPLSIMCGILLGSLIGYLLYKGGNKLSLQYFLIFLTCFLYMVSAGLMSRGVWFLELEQFVRRCDGLDVSETGSGPGSYDISKSVWHVNCCNGLTDGWWMVFNAIFGWTNSATYGSVITYSVYWIVVIIWLNLKLVEEKHGYIPGIPIRWQLKRIKKRVKLYQCVKGSGHQERFTDGFHVNASQYTDLSSNPSMDSPRDQQEPESQALLG